MPYVTAATILAHAQVSTPSAAETSVATTVAAAIEARIATAMTDVTVDPGSDAEAELTRAALDDGAAAYARARSGQRDELGSDIAVALVPVFFRYAPPGIG